MTYFYTDTNDVDVVLQGNFPSSPIIKKFVVELGSEIVLSNYPTGDIVTSQAGVHIYQNYPSNNSYLKFDPSNGLNQSSLWTTLNFGGRQRSNGFTVINNSNNSFGDDYKIPIPLYVSSDSFEHAFLEKGVLIPTGNIYTRQDIQSAASTFYHVPSLNLSAFAPSNFSAIRVVDSSSFVTSTVGAVDSSPPTSVSEFKGKLFIGYGNKYSIFDNQTKTNSIYDMPSGQSVWQMHKVGEKYIASKTSGTFYVVESNGDNISQGENITLPCTTGSDRFFRYDRWSFYLHYINGNNSNSPLYIIDDDLNITTVPNFAKYRCRILGGCTINEDIYLFYINHGNNLLARKIGKVVY
jgi:hypothetical protein